MERNNLCSFKAFSKNSNLEAFIERFGEMLFYHWWAAFEYFIDNTSRSRTLFIFHFLTICAISSGLVSFKTIVLSKHGRSMVWCGFGTCRESSGSIDVKNLLNSSISIIKSRDWLLRVWHFNVLYIVVVDGFFPNLMKLASLFAFHMTEVTQLRCSHMFSY